MVVRWDQPDSYYSHGWLVPLISAGLLWLRRKELAAARVRPCAWGLLVLASSLVLHLLATMLQVGFLSGFALVGVVAGLVLALLGKEVLWCVWFPIAFLFFMVPVPEALIEKVSFNMKLLAASVATAVVDGLGLAAVREGSYIRIPSGTVVVDDVCSGLKYLISLTAFGALYAHISSLRPSLKAVLFALSIPIAFVANVARLTIMVLVGYWWGIGATGKWYSHDVFGFALFAAAFAMLFAAESLMLGRRGRGRPEPEPDGQEGPGPEVQQAPSKPATLATAGRAVPAAALALLGLTAALSLLLSRPVEASPLTEAFAGIPARIGSWSGTDQALTDREYEVLGTRDVLSRVYGNPDGAVANLVIVIAQQVRRRTHAPEQCFTGGGYETVSLGDRMVQVASADGGTRDFTVRELIVYHAGETVVAWYFYKSGPRLDTSYWQHHVAVALRKLRDPDASDVLVRLNAAGLDAAGARETLAAFAAEAIPAVLPALP
jgi:EpsI family protein